MSWLQHTIEHLEAHTTKNGAVVSTHRYSLHSGHSKDHATSPAGGKGRTTMMGAVAQRATWLMPKKWRVSLLSLASAEKHSLRLNRTFPTAYVDLVAVLPVILLSIFYIPTDEVRKRKSFTPQWTFEARDYWPNITADSTNIGIFVLYSVNVFAFFLIVLFHMCVRHHAKHYVSRANRISIVAHIIGGTTAITCLWIGLVTGSKSSNLIGVLAGVCLHSPSTWWQQRNVYGFRDVTLPAYSFMGATTPIALLNVIMEDASYEVVIAAGMQMHVFAWVRILHVSQTILGMNPQTMYDRSVLWAGLLIAPFTQGGRIGPLMSVLFMLWWNFIFNVLEPFPRALLGHNFQLDVTSGMQTKLGESVEHVTSRMRLVYPDDPTKQVAAAVYECVKTGPSLTQRDVTRLFGKWGVLRAKDLAEDLFNKADAHDKGAVSVDEFYEHFSFVYLPVLHYLPKLPPLSEIEKEMQSGVAMEEGDLRTVAEGDSEEDDEDDDEEPESPANSFPLSAYSSQALSACGSQAVSVRGSGVGNASQRTSEASDMSAATSHVVGSKSPTGNQKASDSIGFGQVVVPDATEGEAHCVENKPSMPVSGTQSVQQARLWAEASIIAMPPNCIE